MTFFCSKCGYSGEDVAPHLAPKGSGRTCNYQPIELEPVTEEQAKEILRVWGYELRSSEIKRETK